MANNSREMEDGKLYTNEEIADVVESEGLGYAVQYYLNPELIEDDELKQKWQDAKDALDALTEYLNLDDF